MAKPSNRSTKLFLASLSVVAGMTGWAWLTMTQAAPNTQTDLQSETVETVVQAQPLQASAAAAVVLPPRSNIPNLANLPVRGLRQVGDTMPESVVSQTQPSGGGQNQGGGGSNVQQSQPRQQKQQPQAQPQPQPQPKPKPVRKAKPSK